MSFEQYTKYARQLIAADHSLTIINALPTKTKNKPETHRSVEDAQTDRFEAVFRLAEMKVSDRLLPVRVLITKGSIKDTPEMIHPYSENAVSMRVTNPDQLNILHSTLFNLEWMCDDSEYNGIPVIPDSEAAYKLFPQHDSGLEAPLNYLQRSVRELMHVRKDLSQALDVSKRSRVNWLSNIEADLILRLIQFRQDQALKRYVLVQPLIQNPIGTQMDAVRLATSNLPERARLDFNIDLSRRSATVSRDILKQIQNTGGFDLPLRR